MFDLISQFAGIEKKSVADILAPLKDKITEALGHEPESFSVELNVSEGTMRIASEGRSESFRNKPLISLAMKIVKNKFRKHTPDGKDIDFTMGSIYWNKGQVSMAVKTTKNEILTQDFV